MSDLSPTPMVVASFYRFVALKELADLRKKVLSYGASIDVRGSILLAPEGVNGYISAKPVVTRRFIADLSAILGIELLEHKETACEGHAFGRFKVRLKREIVTLGQPTDPSTLVGRYVEADEWNEIISDPEVTVIDVRNHYEIEEGTFPGAIDPHTASFRQFPEFVRNELDPAENRRVAMFCTGGIRCEKATSYLLEKGFKEVVHLRGGILRYLQTVKPEESRWEGSCYVFDERGTVEPEMPTG